MKKVLLVCNAHLDPVWLWQSSKIEMIYSSGETMRIYENLFKTSENRLNPRSYYIPRGISEYKLLNGEWDFAYFSRDIDVPEKIEKWDKITVPSC